MTHQNRLKLAKKSLKGTSIGDAFGESFFGNTDKVLWHIQNKTIPQTSWEFTDDTVMAIAVFEQLERYQKINQDKLAHQFSLNHQKDVNRGYGATARRILRAIDEGTSWEVISKNVFDGMGSMGNGASMRVTPIGAYFHDDLQKVKLEAIASAEITHSNIEGISGAIAVALAAALSTQYKLTKKAITANEFIEAITKHLPASDTTSKIKKSLNVGINYHTETLKTILGNGSKILAQDTVPFAIWCAAHHLYNFENALWKGVSVLGDRDTICAIIGGITIMSAHEKSIPQEWINAVEKIDKSIFRNSL